MEFNNLNETVKLPHRHTTANQPNKKLTVDVKSKRHRSAMGAVPCVN
jgi:hypothetical protein